jgi:aminoglycoside phosphotransferase (APT) family kinase protein
MIPKAYALASEVATMDFLRSKGLPIPEVYGYSLTSENEAETEYILMQYVEGTDLSQIWFELEEDQIVSIMDQLAKIESTMMSISFPAGGSIYYARDLEELSGNEGIPLEQEIEEKDRFCIGPDVSVPLWYGRRKQLDVFRGPCASYFSYLFCLFDVHR